MRDVPLSLSACYTSEFRRVLFNYGIRMVTDKDRGLNTKRDEGGASSRFVPTEGHQYRRAQVFRMPFKNFNATEKEFIAT